MKIYAEFVFRINGINVTLENINVATGNINARVAYVKLC